MRKYFNNIKIYTANSHIVGWFVTLGNPNDWKAAIVLIFKPSQTNWGHKWFFTKLLPNSWYCPFLVEYVHSGYSSWHPPQKITSWPGYEAESFQPNHQRVWGNESWDGHMQFSTSPSARWTLTFYTKQCSLFFQAIKNIVNKCQEDTRRCHPLDWKQLSSLIKALLKMIFLFLRCDILVPWRYFHVFFLCFKSGFDVLKFPSFVCKLRPCLLSISFSFSHPFVFFYAQKHLLDWTKLSFHQGTDFVKKTVCVNYRLISSHFSCMFFSMEKWLPSVSSTERSSAFPNRRKFCSKSVPECSSVWGDEVLWDADGTGGCSWQKHGNTRRKTNMAPETGSCKRRFLLETIMFRVHVSFLECI